MELTEWAVLQEKLLEAQLSVIRGYIRAAGKDAREVGAIRHEHAPRMSAIPEIPAHAGAPTHVSEIMRRAEELNPKAAPVRLQKESG